MPENTENMKKWIKAWQRASVSLKEVKKKELRSPDYYEKNREMLDEMLQFASLNAKIRLHSGLEKQQRFFLKAKKQLSLKKESCQ